MADLQVGNIGTSIRRTIRDQAGAVVDISGTTVRKFYFRKPNGVVVTKTAALVGGGTGGIMEYVTTAASDLDIPGEWVLQGFITNSSGSWFTNRDRLPVLQNLV